MQIKETQPGFVRITLPWILAAGIFLLYLVTVNRWMSVASLPVVSKVTGWDWTLPVQWPLFFLLTAPFKVLPASVQPIALNIFSALCGAAAVGLLVRAVALLPHDRTHEQRLRERSEFSLLSGKFAWLPPLFAGLIFGLQLTMWEHSTSATAQVLDVLLFAYIVRGLLEYRIDRKESWLTKLALVYGLGITNSYAFIGFFPFFIGALIWIKGKSFFNVRLLGKMLLFGLLGLSLYLLLPIIWSIKNPDPNIGFIDVLRANLASQKAILFSTPSLRNRAFLLSLTSILPILIIAVRWPSSFGDTSASGAIVTNIFFRVVHIAFWLACLAMVFDMRISPRGLAKGLGVNLPFLTFYFLSALAVGYFSGYLLLVFTELKTKHWMRSSGLMKILNPAVRAMVLIAFVAVPILLLVKNIPIVHANNGTMMRDFTQSLAADLPKEPAYLLSEDPFQLSLVQAYLSKEGRANQYVLVNTRSLESPTYHKELSKHYGDRWPKLKQEEMDQRVDPLTILATMMNLSRSNALFYLHPSFGYYFEKMYAVPQGSIYRMKLYNNDEIYPPELSSNDFQHNTDFWKGREQVYDRLRHGRNTEIEDARYLSIFYSRGINNWGVELQKRKQLPEAKNFFERAFELNTNNIPARINLEFNQALQAGKSIEDASERKVEESFGRYRTWDSILSDNGPFDQPQYNFLLGRELLRQSLVRQAVHLFERSAELNPTNLVTRQFLAQSYLFGNWTDRALAVVAKVRNDFPDMPVTNRMDFITLESACFSAQGNFDQAEKVLIAARNEHPNEPHILDSLVELYRVHGKASNAVAVLDEKIKLRPNYSLPYLQKAELLLAQGDFDNAEKALNKVLENEPRNTAAQLYKGYLLMQKKDWASARREVEKVLTTDPENAQALIYLSNIQMESKEFDKALKNLDKILDKTPDSYVALRNRAIIALEANRLEVAEKDFDTLRKMTPRSHAPYFGLGEVAFRNKDYQEAVEAYENYLKYAPKEGGPDLAEEKKQVQAKLDESRAKLK